MAGRGQRVLEKRQAVIQALRPARPQPLPSAHGEVAQVAYQLFEQRGKMHGSDQQDWFEAERIVRQRRRNQ